MRALLTVARTHKIIAAPHLVVVVVIKTLDPVPAVATVNRQAAPMITVVAMLSFVAVKKNASLHQQVETKEHHRLQQTSAQAIVAPATPHSSRMPTPLIVVPTHKETAASIPNAVTILVIVPSTMIALSMEINSYDQTLQTFNALAEVENKQIVAKRQEPHYRQVQWQHR